MIERRTITAVSTHSQGYARYDFAKQLADLIVEKIDNASIFAEYLDGKIIKIDGMDVLFCVCISGSYIIIASVQQKSDALSEDISSVVIATDYDTSQRAIISSKSGAQVGSEWQYTSTVTMYINGDDIIFAIEKIGFLYLQDENGVKYAGTSYTTLLDSDGNLGSIGPTHAQYLRRENASEVCIMPAFYYDQVQYTARMKNLYSILLNDNVAEWSRYKFDGREYFALTNSLMFRLEGED